MSVTPIRHLHPAPRTAFVLGGGGNLGAVQVGMLRALVERGITPDVLVGCSVGALNAAGLASSPDIAGVEHLHRRWLGTIKDGVFPPGRLNGPWMLLRKATSLYGNQKLRDLIERSVPYRSFEDAVVPVHVVATSLHTGRERWFSSGPVIEPILASAALPAVFPPVVIDGEPLIDGAVVDNVPVSRALSLGATRLYVLHVGNFQRPRQIPRRPIDVLLQSFSIARNHRFLTESAAEAEGVELVTLPGIDPGGLKRNDFTRSLQLMERAHAAAGSFLDARKRAASGT